MALAHPVLWQCGGRALPSAPPRNDRGIGGVSLGRLAGETGWRGLGIAPDLWSRRIRKPSGPSVQAIDGLGRWSRSRPGATCCNWDFEAEAPG